MQRETECFAFHFFVLISESKGSHTALTCYYKLLA